MNIIEKKMKHISYKKISILPTPFYKLKSISKILNNNIYIKRDDLTGFALSGNKTRKFDYLIADAINQGCDTIIGIGANQSNFCRILSVVGAKYDMSVHLILNGKKPEKPTGNLLIDHMLGANIYHIDTTDSKIRMQKALEVKESLEKKGHKVYFLPPGGSTVTGTFGYAAGFGELLNDFDKNNVKIDKIFHASSSAGTQAGLVLGKAISKWEGKIIGISVDVPELELKNDVYQLAKNAGKLLDIEIDINSVLVDTDYIGEGYAKRTPGCEEAVMLFAKNEGVFLDYVYTGKGAAGLINYCRIGKIQPEENILFIHTGGNIELFE